jgi:starvation-inducible DNA-binding protein
MNELVQTLKVLLANTVLMKYKAQGYHWNVQSDDFPQYHELFGKIYDSMDGAVDPLGEWILMMGEFAPFKLSRFVELATLPEPEVSSDPMMMAADLKACHDLSAAAFGAASKSAADLGQKGLENFLADCQAAHQKWSWQLRASLTETEAE